MKMFRTNSRAMRLFTRPLLVVGAAMLALILSTTAVFASYHLTFAVGGQSAPLTYGTAGSRTFAITVNRNGSGSGGAVTLTVTGLPAGVTGSFSPAGFNLSTGPFPFSSTLTVTTVAGTPAATTTFTVGTSGPTDTGTGTLTVSKKTLTVSGITANNKEYDGLIGATLNTSSAALVGVVVGDTVTLNKTSASGAFSDKNAADGKTVTVSNLAIGGSSAGNYALTQPTTTADITKAPLTVTADAKSRTYGDANPAFTASYSGFKNGETLVTSGVTGSPSLTVTATPSSPVSGSPYAITAGVGTLAATNYSFTPVNGQLTLNAAPLTVTTVNKSKTYGDTFNPANYSGTVTGQKNGDSITIASYASDGAAPSAAAGAYDITATLSDPGSKLANYALTNNYGKLTVIPATGQTWYLYSDDIMRKSLTPTASITINPHASRVWTADQKAWSAVTFPDGSWVIYLKTSQDWSGSCTAEVGYWNGSFHPFTTGAPVKSWDSGTGILTIRAQAGSETINANDYLALRVTNNDNAGSHDVITDGNSWVKSPASDPGYPLPELASGILFGLGLAGTGTFIIIRRKKAAGFEAHV
jgi:hypothetical protein